MAEGGPDIGMRPIGYTQDPSGFRQDCVSRPQDGPNEEVSGQIDCHTERHAGVDLRTVIAGRSSALNSKRRWNSLPDEKNDAKASFVRCQNSDYRSRSSAQRPLSSGRDTVGETLIIQDPAPIGRYPHSSRHIRRCMTVLISFDPCRQLEILRAIGTSNRRDVNGSERTSQPQTD